MTNKLPNIDPYQILPEKDEIKINDFFTQNYDDVFSRSETKDEFLNNLEKKKKR